MAQRKRHTGQFKARVAIEPIAGHKTVNQIAAEYGIHPSQVNKWKKQAVEGLPEVECLITFLWSVSGVQSNMKRFI